MAAPGEQRLWKKIGIKSGFFNRNCILTSLQNDLLAQTPKVRAFLTHGGLNSLFEGAYHGVPMVTLPIMGDQLDNAMRSEELGIGITLGFRLPRDGSASIQANKITADDAFNALNR